MSDKQLEVGEVISIEGSVKHYDVVTDSLLIQLTRVPEPFTVMVPSSAIAPPVEYGEPNPPEYLFELVEEIARVTHEINRAYCLAMGDRSHLRWEDAPDWQRESEMQGVEFHLRHPNAGPEASHENWCEKKRLDGWRYGEAKDPELKTHPCLVLFDELPSAQQAKDYIFHACVHAAVQLLADVDFARGISSRPHTDEEES